MPKLHGLTETLEIAGDVDSAMQVDDARVGDPLIHGMTEILNFDQPADLTREERRHRTLEPAPEPMGTSKTALAAFAAGFVLGVSHALRLRWQQWRSRRQDAR